MIYDNNSGEIKYITSVQTNYFQSLLLSNESSGEDLVPNIGSPLYWSNVVYNSPLDVFTLSNNNTITLVAGRRYKLSASFAVGKLGTGRYFQFRFKDISNNLMLGLSYAGTAKLFNLYTNNNGQSDMSTTIAFIDTISNVNIQLIVVGKDNDTYFKKDGENFIMVERIG